MTTTTKPGRRQRAAKALADFMRLESAGGTLLLITAILALLVANSPLNEWYQRLIDTPVAVQVGALTIAKPLLLWVNDGLMAIFFFLIGLEIKREVLEGELSKPANIVLPGLGALGGMLVPAGMYYLFNSGDQIAIDGWAIPVATDIAFALALLSVFGSRVPVGLKVFLLTLAILDDLAAIVIIALFYSGDLSYFALGTGAAALSVAVIMNLIGVSRTSMFLLVGLVLWVAVLKSGVHATLAGVLLAYCIPIRAADGTSPLRSLEHNLHGSVAYIILPIFAFANAGLHLAGVGWGDIAHPVTLGIIFGLLVGKPLGIMLFAGGAVYLKLVKLPEGVTLQQIFGVGFACGIGFTMSLFIAGLAFEHSGGEYYAGDKLGILIASTLSALCALMVLAKTLPKKAFDTDTVPETVQ
ncbi:MAG: Na+/H+ antiporter NhaA [Pseudomonadota bacterium]